MAPDPFGIYLNRANEIAVHGEHRNTVGIAPPELGIAVDVDHFDGSGQRPQLLGQIDQEGFAEPAVGARIDNPLGRHVRSTQGGQRN